MTQSRSKPILKFKFKKHAGACFQGTLKKVLARTGLLSLQDSRMQSLEELRNKFKPASTRLSQPAGKDENRVVKQQSPDSDDDVPIAEILGAVGVPAHADDDDDGSGFRSRTPRKDQPGSSTDGAGKRDGIPLGAMPIVIPRKRTAHDTKYPLGSSKHWIDRSPPEEALLNVTMQREKNQLTLVQNSKTASESEKNSAESHQILLNHCASLWRENLSRLPLAKKKSAVSALEAESIKWPISTQLDLLSYACAAHWTEIKEYNYLASAAGNKALGDMLQVILS